MSETTQRVFVCHASADAAAAGRLVAGLEASGTACWISGRDVRPGENFQEAIVHAIRNARVLVFLLSDAANRSEEVRKELALAGSFKLTVLPVRIGAVEPVEALRYELATRQWIDAADADAAVPALHAALGGTVAPGRVVDDLVLLQLPDKPSVVVLPFANLSGDPEQEYFADGLTEELITALARIRAFFVIARHSSFAYKGRSIDVKQVGRELGVRYVVEGSVRRGGNRLRIASQLADATTGTQIWADRFDGTPDDVFDLQDRVTMTLISAVEPSIRASEIDRARHKPTVNLAAHDLVLRALPLIYAFTREGLRDGAEMLRQACVRDPDYGFPKVLAAMCLWWQMTQGWVARSAATTVEIERLAREAVAQAPDDPEVLSYGGFLLVAGAGDMRAGLPHLLHAVTLNPSSAHALGLLAEIHVWRGDPEGALACAAQSRRLSPMARQASTDLAVAMACYFTGAYADALVAADLRIAKGPTFQEAWKLRAASLARLGRMDEARQAVDELLRLAPDMTVSRQRAQLTVGNQGFPVPALVDPYCEGLRLAGLPE